MSTYPFHAWNRLNSTRDFLVISDDISFAQLMQLPMYNTSCEGSEKTFILACTMDGSRFFAPYTEVDIQASVFTNLEERATADFFFNDTGSLSNGSDEAEERDMSDQFEHAISLFDQRPDFYIQSQRKSGSALFDVFTQKINIYLLEKELIVIKALDFFVHCTEVLDTIRESTCKVNILHAKERVWDYIYHVTGSKQEDSKKSVPKIAQTDLPALENVPGSRLLESEDEMDKMHAVQGTIKVHARIFRSVIGVAFSVCSIISMYRQILEKWSTKKEKHRPKKKQPFFYKGSDERLSSWTEIVNLSAFDTLVYSTELSCIFARHLRVLELKNYPEFFDSAFRRSVGSCGNITSEWVFIDGPGVLKMCDLFDSLIPLEIQKNVLGPASLPIRSKIVLFIKSLGTTVWNPILGSFAPPTDTPTCQNCGLPYYSPGKVNHETHDIPHVDKTKPEESSLLTISQGTKEKTENKPENTTRIHSNHPIEGKKEPTETKTDIPKTCKQQLKQYYQIPSRRNPPPKQNISIPQTSKIQTTLPHLTKASTVNSGAIVNITKSSVHTSEKRRRARVNKREKKCC